MDQKVSSVAMKVNGLVKEYVNIEEDIFKPSFRKIIPIPGIFRPVNYQAHFERLQEMEDELGQAKDSIRSIKPDGKEREGRFLITLRAYISVFMRAVAQLEDISIKLKQRSNGDKYAKKDYRQDAVSLRKTEKEYFDIGRKLNQIYRELNLGENKK